MSAQCSICACTEERACEGGCAWVEQGPKPLCSACVPSLAALLDLANCFVEAARKSRELADTLKDGAPDAQRIGWEITGHAVSYTAAAAQLKALVAIAARLPDPRLLHLTSMLVDAGAVLSGDELDEPGRIVVPR